MITYIKWDDPGVGGVCLFVAFRNITSYYSTGTMQTYYLQSVNERKYVYCCYNDPDCGQLATDVDWLYYGYEWVLT